MLWKSVQQEVSFLHQAYWPQSVGDAVWRVKFSQSKFVYSFKVFTLIESISNLMEQIYSLKY